VDSRIVGKDAGPKTPGILNQRGLYLRNVSISGYAKSVDIADKGTMLRNNGGKLWILGMKTEKVGTIVETLNGGITAAAGLFIYSNQGWEEKVPAFVIHDSTAILAGISERNFNRRPVSFWLRETQGNGTRESKEPAWVYLSR
jgi:hypothetical protein